MISQRHSRMPEETAYNWLAAFFCNNEKQKKIKNPLVRLR